MALILGLLQHAAVLVATNDTAMAVFLVAGACGLVFRHENGVDLPRSPGGVVIGLVCIACSVPLRGALWLVKNHAHLGGLGIRHRWKKAAEANKEDPGTVLTTGPIIVRDELVGHRLFVRMPPGTIAGDYNAERVASAYRAVRTIVEADPHDKQVAIVSVYTHEPLTAPLDLLPLVETETPPGLVTIGLSYDGDALEIDTRLANVKTGGNPRQGKSNFLHLLIADYARRRDARIVILDGKSIDFPDWEDRCAFYASNDPERPGQHIRDALGILDACLADMDARYAAMKAAGFKNAQAMPKGHESKPAPLLIVVDEIPRYLDDRTPLPGNDTLGKAIERTLIRLLREGLAADVHVAVSTQKATADAIPTAISALCDVAVAFRCSTYQMGEAILGTAALGLETTQLPAGDAHRGRCIVLASDSQHTHGRCYHASDAWIRRAAALTPRSDLDHDLDVSNNPDPDRGLEPRARTREAPADPAAPSGSRGRPGPKPGSAAAHQAAANARAAKQRRLEAVPDDADRSHQDDES